MIKKLLFVAVIFITAFVTSQESIRTMTYNVVKFTTTSSADKQTGHEYIYAEIKPDILMVQEAGVNSPDHILGKLNAIENKYLKTTRFSNIVNPLDDNGQLVFYNKNILQLEREKALASSTRNINRYTFKFKKLDIDGNPVYLEVFVAHLKSSDGTVERTERSSMIDTFITELSTVDSNRYIIFAGDLNLYSSNEPAYVKLLNGTSLIKLNDPINRPCETMPEDGFNYWSTFPIPREVKYFWQDNINFQDIHTQNTRSSSGGLDDRFDFILTSENLMNANSNLTFTANSYKAYGNNGNCLNKDIADATCIGTYSATLRQHLRNASDHIPVIMDLQFKSSTLSNTNYSLQTVSFVSSNVASNSLILSINDQVLNSELHIYNQLGQLVKSVILNYQTVYNNQLTIDISHLNSGVYYINLTNNALSHPLKFIKN